MTEELKDGITAELIKAMKDRYGDNKIKIATLPKDEDATETLDVLVRVPDRKTQGEFEKWYDKSPDKAKEILVNACVLTSKEQVKADDGLFAGAIDALSKLLVVRTAVIKNC